MESDLGENEFISQYQYTSERVDLSPAISRFIFYTHFYYSDGDRLVNSQWFNELKVLAPKLSVISASGRGYMLSLENTQKLENHINSWVKS